MDYGKRIGLVGILYGILFVLVMAGFFMGILPTGYFIALFIIEIGMAIYFYYFIMKPWKNFEQALYQSFERDGDSGEILKSLPKDMIYIEKIMMLLEKCINQGIRENSAMMFDKQAEYTALQSQINPHFLCNTLESIRGQALMDDNSEIAKMVEALASFFRYSISRKGNFVTLREELANIRNYMMIQRYRFNNRFSMEIFIDEEDEKAYDYLIPKLILQPVIENAIYHGLEEKLEGGKVEIEIIVTETNLILTISDNGIGMDGKTLSELNRRIHSPNSNMEEDQKERQYNTGIALPNIHKRIQLLFGEEYGLNVYSTLNRGTDVEINIPANYERKIN